MLMEVHRVHHKHMEQESRLSPTADDDVMDRPTFIIRRHVIQHKDTGIYALADCRRYPSSSITTTRPSFSNKPLTTTAKMPPPRIAADADVVSVVSPQALGSGTVVGESSVFWAMTTSQRRLRSAAIVTSVSFYSLLHIFAKDISHDIKTTFYKLFSSNNKHVWGPR
jgi:hypothetical protein